MFQITLSFVFSLLVYGLIAFSFIKKDGFNYLQPHSYRTLMDVVKLVIFPLAQYLLLLNTRIDGVIYFNWIILISYLSYSIGYGTPKKRFLSGFNNLVYKFDISNIPKKVATGFVISLFLSGVLVYLYMSYSTNFGLYNWITKPRIGYQLHRTGQGHFYVTSLGLINFSYLMVLFFKAHNIKRFIFVTALYFFISYFWGSKGIVFFTFFEAIIYYNYFIRRLCIKDTLFVLFLGIIIFVALFVVYDKQLETVKINKQKTNFSAQSTVNIANKKSSHQKPEKQILSVYSLKILDYADYYNNGRIFFNDFSQKFNYQLGKEYLSGFWQYVPRKFYPEKPYSYGIVKFVTENYYPDAGKRGHTPAFGGPVEEFLNFGIIGVVLIGLANGYLISLFYEYFKETKGFLGFVLFSNSMGFWIFPFLPGSIYRIGLYLIVLFLIKSMCILTIKKE